MEEGIIGLFAIFAIFIAFPWIVLNFLARRRESAAPAAGDPAMSAALVSLAEKLERRVDAIETILDHEAPGWRKNIDRRTP